MVLGGWVDGPARRRLDDAVAVAIGLAGVALAQAPSTRSVLPIEAPAWWWVDLVGGVAGCGLLLARRRAPVVVAVVLAVGELVITTGWMAMLVATFAVAVRRSWPIAVGVAALTVLFPALQEPIRAVTPTAASWSTVAWAVVLATAVVAAGYAVRIRHALMDSLIERAERAEAEAALRADAARAAERTRIAREMHDVLAHRLSLLSMHAGALAHRRNPEPDDVREAVEVIRASARDALQDLRAILGVLRAPDGDDGGDGVETADHAPQPTLADLPRLLDRVRATGTTIDLRDDLVGGAGSAGPDGVPDDCGRAIYRVAQEALTNATRHAPGQPVAVRLNGSPDGEVILEVSNPLVTGSRVDGGAGGGNGLVGVAERVVLAGGRVLSAEADGARFRLAVALPWRTGPDPDTKSDGVATHPQTVEAP